MSGCFEKLATVMNLATMDDRLFFFVMTLAFHFFMRVSEVLSLRPEDVTLDREKNTLSVNFWKTKTDQYGTGTVSFISLHDDICCPGQYVDVIEKMPKGRPLFELTPESLNSKWRGWLEKINVANISQYSWEFRG